MAITTFNINPSNKGIDPIYLIRLNEIRWETAISQEEYDSLVQNGTFNGRPTYNFTALFKPIRNHKVKAFLEDLTLPLVFNLALKIDKIVPKIFAIFFAVCVDVVTLPIRLITAIPRFLHKQPLKKEHLFYKFLQAKGCDPNLLNKIDSCCIELLRISKSAHAATKFFDMELKAGVWTNYRRGSFSLNFVEQAFVRQNFTNFNWSSFGRNFGSEFYKKCFFKAYPHISEKEFEEIEKQHNNYLKYSLLQEKPINEFLDELTKYIPKIVEEIKNAKKIDESYEEIYRRLKKAYQAFMLKYHPDKGGDHDEFIRISQKWDQLTQQAKSL